MLEACRKYGAFSIHDNRFAGEACNLLLAGNLILEGKQVEDGEQHPMPVLQDFPETVLLQAYGKEQRQKRYQVPAQRR